MKALTHLIDKVIEKFLILLMAVMVLSVTWQVVTRFLMASPSSYTEELARFLLIWIGVLGGSYALRTRSHLGIDILAKKLNPGQREILNIFVYSLILLFSVLIMLVGGIKLVALTFLLDQTSASLGIKMGYIYLVLPISGTVMLIYSLDVIFDSYKVVRAGRRDR